MRISDWSSDVCSSDLRFSCISRTTCLMSFSVPARRGACAISFCTLDGINVAAAATDATCAAFVSNRRRVNTGALDIDELLTFPVLRFSRRDRRRQDRSEEHTSELQSLMRISYAVFC